MIRLVALAPLLAVLGGCVSVAEAPPPRPAAERTAPPPAAPAPLARPAPAPPLPSGPARFEYDGQLTQGGWIRGRAPAGTIELRLGERQVTLDRECRFFAAFDRDAGPQASLVALRAGGMEERVELAIAPRGWDLEHVDAALRPGTSNDAFLAQRRPELERIAAARARTTTAQGWRESFVWPVTGRISGRFGAQRIYRGEPGSYHSGLDIARPTGTEFVAPASGVVVLASEQPFTLEGYLLILDHGHGLSSAFLHLSQIDVREGESVAQGQVLGRIGATGRTSGPHLHWGLVWQGARLDPLLFLGPMPGA